MSRSILPTAEMSVRRASRINLIPVDGSSLTTTWFASVCGPMTPEAQRRRTLEDEPQLGLGHGEPLPGPDEERDTRPSPVLDLEPHRGVGLGGRVRRHAVDVEIPVVLASHVVSRVGLDDRVEQGHLGVLDRLQVTARRRLHRGRGHDLHQVVDHDVAHRTDGIVEVAPVLDAEVSRTC